MSLKDKQRKYERKSALAKTDYTDEIDKIKLYYFQQNTQLLPHDEEIILTEGQHEKRKKLQIIWTKLITLPREQVIEDISREHAVSDRQARNLVRQAQELFGEVQRVNKLADRSLRVAQREAIIQLIKEDDMLDEKDRYDLIDKYMTAIEKMSDLYKPDEMTTEEILDKLKLPDVVISTDPKVLQP